MASPAESKDAQVKGTVARLIKYVEGLKQRLYGAVPAKHAHRSQVFKDMLTLDMKKTQAKIDKLK